MKIKINKNNGYAITEFLATNSITFIGDIPDDAVVKSVSVNGKHLEDYIECDVVYPRTLKDGNWRVIAVMKNSDRTDLHIEAEAGKIIDFVVEVE